MREAELLAAIGADLDDDAARRVYADYLQEQEDPRGELIQLELAYADMLETDERRSPTTQRINVLIREHGDRWLQPFRSRELGDITFHLARGIPASIQGSIAHLARHSTELLLNMPLFTTLRIRARAGEADLTKLRDSALLDQVRELGFAAPRIRMTGWEALAAPRLRDLELTALALGPNDLAAVLGRTPSLARLTIRDCRLNKSVVEGLVYAVGAIAQLDVTAAHFGPRLGHTLGGTAAFSRLTRAMLAGNQIGSAGLAAMRASLANVVELDLRGNELAIEDVPPLLDALGAVRVLELGDNALGDDGAAMIASWPGAKQLSRLHLGNAGVTPTGARLLAKSDNLAQLKSLVLSGSHYDTGTEADIAKAFKNARVYLGDHFLKRT